jgi:hypothetical protein
MAKFKTVLAAKEAELLERGGEQYQTIASRVQEKYGFELQPQIDILYVKSCLVTAGEKYGINDNDDVFTREEAWAARHTPVLKPANWQHNDKDILGVVFSVEARTLDGRLIPFDQEEVPEEEFEFHTEAAIFKFIHPEKSKEIAERSAAGNLFVSMEAWFDDYQYGLYNEDGVLNQVIARNAETKFLDGHLKCKGGVGKYNNQRLGRVLQSITFGGFGFVDKPANKRSFIEEVGDVVPAAASHSEEQVERLLREVMSKIESSNIQETAQMTTKANAEGVVTSESIEAAVAKAFSEHKNAEAKAAAEEALRTKASQLTQANETLAEEKAQLDEAVKAKDNEISALKDQMNELSEVVESISAEIAKAQDSAPGISELAGIDGVSDGDSAWSAKLELFRKMGPAMAALADRNSELEVEVAKAAQATRASEVRGLFEGLMTETEVEALIATASELGEDEYVSWSQEKALFSLALTQAAKGDDMKGEEDEKMKGKKNPFGKKGKASEDEGLSLVQKAIRARMEGGGGDEYGSRSSTHLVNHPGGENMKSGVTPGAPGLSTPRHKIAGSAEADPNGVLAQAIAQGGINPAGANMSDNGVDGQSDDDVFGFRSLAADLTGYGEEDEDQSEADESGLNFDPVAKN